MKSEADVYSIADLERDGSTHWDGVRNYWARNFMQAMKVGDKVLFYHSNSQPSGVAGVAKVVKRAYADHTAFDPDDGHFDAKSDPDDPTWYMVDLAFEKAFPATLSLDDLKGDAKLDGMMLVSGKAMRLSVQPVDKAHFEHVVKVGLKKRA